jgi:hypothetical protein
MADDQTRVWVGAFGKHPGWDDHLADQGLETELMVRIKRLMYVEGIGGNLDAGSWDALAEDERHDGFDHVFLWRWAEGLVVGRMWSSSDGKGRKRYPMIVVAHARGIASSWVAGPCFDRLERLGSECRAASDAAGVIMAVDRARQELRASGGGAPLAKSEGISGTAALVDLATCGRMGEQDEGLVRVAYQLEREFSSFLKPGEDTGQKSRTVDVRPRHMRVPACHDDAVQACERWIRHLLDRVDQSSPILAIAPVAGGHVDLVVGEAARGQFLCLQATEKRVPLTTDIPYTIDDEFRLAVQGRIAAARQGAVRDRDPGVVGEAASVARRVVGQGVKTATDKKTVKMAAIVGGALVVLLIVIVIIAMSGGKKALPPVPPVVDGGNSPTVEVKASETQIEEFRAWCLAYSGWLKQLTDDVQRRGESVQLDDHFSSRVIAPVASAVAERVRLNPRDVVSNPPPTVAILAENVPSEIARPEITRETARATLLIAAIGDGVRSWPAVAETRALVSQFTSLGWNGPAAELSAMADAVQPGASANLIDAASALKRVRDAVSPLGAMVGELSAAAERMKASGDTVLAAESEALTERLKAMSTAATVAELTDRASGLEESVGLAARVVSVLDSTWENVDREAFVSAARVHAANTSLRGPERLRLWLAEVGQETYQALRADEDPRRTLTAERDLASATTELETLRARGGADAESAVNALRARVDDLGSRLAELAAMRWNRLTRQGVEQASESLDRDVRSLTRDIGGLRGSIETDATEYVLSQQALSSISSDGLVAIDEVWTAGRDALLLRFETDASLMGLRRDLDRLRGALRLIEEASRVELLPEDMGSGWNIGVVRELLREFRNAQVSSVSQAWRGGAVANEEDVAARVGASAAEWAARVAARVARLREIEQRVQALHAIDQVGPNGETIESLMEFEGDGLGDALAWAPGLWKRVDMLRAAREARGNRAAMLALAGDAGLAGGALLDIWRQLAAETSDWPATLAELQAGMEWRNRILTESAGLDDAEAAAALRAELDGGLAGAWVRAIEANQDRAEFEAVLRLRDRCGGDLLRTSQVVRERVLAMVLREAMAGEVGADDEAHRTLVREQVRALSLGDVRTGWVADVMAVVDEPSDGLPPLDPAAVGPARAGWKVDSSSTEQLLVYTSGSGNAEMRLEFRLVTDDAGRSSYVGVHEVSVGVVGSLVASDALAHAVLLKSLETPGTREESRPGMLTWQWRGTRDEASLGAAESWLALAFEPQDYYAKPDRSAGPGRMHPMHRVGLADALYIAGRLGCRLPTAGEWQAALKEIGTVDAAAGWNLRDARVAEQSAHVRARLATSGWRGKVPDEGSFEAWRTDETHGFNDEHLWVSTVESGPPVAFRHLIGNVGEYVVVSAGDLDGYLKFGSEVESVDAVAAQNVAKSLRAGVVGGSVFSGSGVAIAEPIETGNVVNSWSDVGLRLAFTGHARLSVAARVSAIVGESGF